MSWMVMVSEFIEISEYREAWGVFLMMVGSGVRLDRAVLVVALLMVMRLNDLELVETLRILTIKTMRLWGLPFWMIILGLAVWSLVF